MFTNLLAIGDSYFNISSELTAGFFTAAIINAPKDEISRSSNKSSQMLLENMTLGMLGEFARLIAPWFTTLHFTYDRFHGFGLALPGSHSSLTTLDKTLGFSRKPCVQQAQSSFNGIVDSIGGMQTQRCACATQHEHGGGLYIISNPASLVDQTDEEHSTTAPTYRYVEASTRKQSAFTQIQISHRCRDEAEMLLGELKMGNRVKFRS